MGQSQIFTDFISKRMIDQNDRDTGEKQQNNFLTLISLILTNRHRGSMLIGLVKQSLGFLASL